MIKQLFKKYKSLISYLFWGVVTTLVNIVVFAVLVDQLHIFYQVSNVIAWFVSVLVAYVSNKLWVFNSHTSTASDLFAEALRFFLMRAATLVIDNVVVIISNYAFSKLVVFRTKKKWE